ncbi:hypothetical protein [Thermomonospora curvata]|uniref:Uncharacterized protein n=1 Tax=Thermomonospora curvata (strain ATCC 19995 / DSM 43183 / JCM 3096 / KCTC 9072 / NBRC 15933 / NCIMB 10081 / Henssen B9) TaxID=471852 RepID=D1A8V2_THECD|nr:hypothetical protein [Thermomonospora curvata]ACY98590.1 hypothetical protein Tcur_3048 [Thermomonospora curvata DSM 43183]
MTDRPGDVLDEAVRLLDGLRTGDPWSRAVPRQRPPHTAPERPDRPPHRATAPAAAVGAVAGDRLPDAAATPMTAAWWPLEALERSNLLHPGAGRREGSGGEPVDAGAG